MVTTQRARALAPLSLEVFARVEDARDDWRALLAETAASPYQNYDYARLWAATIGRAEGLTPAIVVLRDARGTPYALFPFATRRSKFGLRVAEYICGRESNLNLPLIRPGLDIDFAACLRAAAAKMPEPPDLYLLKSQPRRFDGEDNPLVPPGAERSPSAAYGASLGRTFAPMEERFSSGLRKKLRYHRRKLQQIGALAFEHAADGARKSRIVRALCAQKAARLAHLGTANPFAHDAMSGFLAAIAEHGVLEVHALSINARVVATYVGLAHAGRFSVLANSFELDKEVARFGPGEVLLHALLDDLGSRGFLEFDLGIGEAAYKDAVCDEKIELFDAVFAVSAAGAIAAPLYCAATRAKREIKRRPWLARPIERLRRSGLAPRG